jgi:hypothetical protein
MTGAGVVTVADLLNRNAPVPVAFDDEEDAGRGISVGSLLRREGRAPHAIDRPIHPRAHQQSDDAGDKPATDRSAHVRRGAIAAGTLLAAGSVFGAAVLAEVAPATGTQDPPTNGTYPGQGLLDPDNPLVPPAGTVQLDQAASVNALDPGAAAPTAWVPIAFPSALAGVPTGTAAAAASDAAAQAAGGGNGGSTPGGDSGSGGTGGAGGGGGNGDDSIRPSGGGGRGADRAADDDKSVVGDLGDGVGGAAKRLGGGVGGPVGDTVSGLGGAVNDTTDALDGAANGLLGRDDDDDDDRGSDDRRSARSSAESSGSDDGSSSSSAPQDEESSDDDGDSDGSSRGLLSTVGDLAGGLLR